MLKALNAGGALTAMMIDIDKFKAINDVYGHNVVDEVIKDIAVALKQHFPNDIVARMRGRVCGVKCGYSVSNEFGLY